MTVAHARHILTKTKTECLDILDKIYNGEDFAEMAKKFSLCPSGKKGGDLGEFTPGMMVKEFDKVVFKEKVGDVHGPIKTNFGYHLIQILERKD